MSAEIWENSIKGDGVAILTKMSAEIFSQRINVLDGRERLLNVIAPARKPVREAEKRN